MAFFSYQCLDHTVHLDKQNYIHMY